MTKSTLKKTLAEPTDICVLASQLKAGLLTVDPKADVAVGVKPGQVLVWFEGRTYEFLINERSG